MTLSDLLKEREQIMLTLREWFTRWNAATPHGALGLKPLDEWALEQATPVADEDAQLKV